MQRVWPLFLLVMATVPVSRTLNAQSSFVQKCAGSASATTSSCTLNNVSAGDLLAAACINDTAASTLTSISDSEHNPYTVTPNSPATGKIWMAYAAPVKGGNTTISCSVPGRNVASLWVVEFSGVGVLDKDAYASASSGAAVNTPSLTPSQPGEALFAAAFSSGDVIGIGNGWTLDSVVAGNAAEYQISKSVSAQAVYFSQIRSLGWSAIEAAFMPSSVILPPPQAAAAQFTNLAFDEEFNTPDLAPAASSTGTYNWYPGIWWEWPAPPASLTTIKSGVLDLDWNKASYLTTHLTDSSVEAVANDASAGLTFRYGYFEARMKWDYLTGAWPAIWMLPIQGIQGKGPNPPPTGEIDIFEGQGGSNYYYGTIHTWIGGQQTWYSSPNNFKMAGNNDFTQWHLYGILWTPPIGVNPGNITWYYDNNAVGSSPTTSSPGSVFDTQNYFLVIGSQDGPNWSAGSLTGVTASDLNVYVDWVRVWQ